MMEADGRKKADAQKRIGELKVIQSELKSVRKGSKVYKQQPNSDIFFLDNKSRMFAEAKRELDGLIQEYGDIENEPENTEEGGTGDGQKDE